MKKHTTRRTLVMSLLSLLLCCSMLVGTTFAWFTDSVTSGRNKIVAGNLDVTLDYYDTATKTFKEVTSDVKLFDETNLWEPGHTEIAYLKVANAGSLALKYQLLVNIYGEQSGTNVYDETFRLSDYLVFKVIEIEENEVGTFTRETARTEAGNEWGLKAFESDVKALEKTGDADYVMMVIYMPESVDNKANYKTGTAAPFIEMGVVLNATQYTYEEDSFDEKYDMGAVYADVTVSTAAELEAAINAGHKLIAIRGAVTLTKSLDANGVTFVADGQNAAIDFLTHGISGNGNTFKGLTLDNDRDGWYKGMQYSNAENTTYVECVIANGVTTYGNSTFKGCTFNQLPNGKYPLFVYDGDKQVVEDCTFYYGDRAIKIYNEGYCPNIEMSVSGTSFKASDTSAANKAVIEIDDAKMTSVKVNVTDIAIDSAIAAQGVYRIDDGQLDTSTEKSVVTVDGVVTSAKAASQAELANALAADGEVYVELAAGTYKLPSVASDEITIVGTGDDTVFDFTGVANVSGASVSFENVKFQGTNDNVMNGFGIQGTSGHVSYKNCTFDGAVTNEYYGSVSYEKCTFTGTGYITTYAVKSATFEKCVFNKADSRAILVYSHGDNPCVVKINGCEFTAAQKAQTWNGDWTAAVEVDTTNIPSAGTSVTITGSTCDANYSGIVRDKSAAGKETAVITVDGAAYTK